MTKIRTNKTFTIILYTTTVLVIYYFAYCKTQESKINYLTSLGAYLFGLLFLSGLMHCVDRLFEVLEEDKNEKEI